jgi:hypothetical protein
VTFNPLAANSVYECIKLIENDIPLALDLGSQTCTINNKFIEYLKNNKNIKNAEILKKLSLLKLKPSFTTYDYFKAIGYDEYSSIDINGAYNSYKFDLNLDIKSEYKFDNQYDLVINNGTGEHVFNQYNLYLNFHNLTKINGIMLNIVPFINWINHGFYNYNPIFFGDLAAANNYKILKLTFANRDGAELIIPQENFSFLYEQIKPHEKNGEFEKIVSFAKQKLGQNIFLVSISQKSSNKDFITPLQGKYLSDLETEVTNYSKQKKGSALSMGQVPDNKKRE